MKLTFLGTRGEIEARTALHRMHTCLMADEWVLVDCGADWLGKLQTLCPQAIILTHAHPDHAAGLKRGAPCTVYATPETWNGLKRYPVRDRETIDPRRPVRIGHIEFEAFSVDHSLIAPAGGYRITANGVAVLRTRLGFHSRAAEASQGFSCTLATAHRSSRRSCGGGRKS